MPEKFDFVTVNVFPAVPPIQSAPPSPAAELLMNLVPVTDRLPALFD